jgi:hypothetical protein
MAISFYWDPGNICRMPGKSFTRPLSIARAAITAGRNQGRQNFWF